MPSAQHQTLLLWGIRAMQRDGYEMLGVDGCVEPSGIPPSVARPPALAGIRPDGLGFNAAANIVGFVEAKTARDIDNAHTRRQLRTLAQMQMHNARGPCPIYIAIPRAAAYALDRVLIELGLLRARHVHRIHVPGAFLA